MIDVEIGHDHKFHINYAVPKITTCELNYLHIMYINIVITLHYIMYILVKTIF